VQAEDEAITRDCVAALAELREKVDLHRAHVDVQLRQVCLRRALQTSIKSSFFKLFGKRGQLSPKVVKTG
jgi:hypothetical protein